MAECIPDEAGFLNAFNADFTGRLAKAFNGHDRFNRWGRHYILALTRSH